MISEFIFEDYIIRMNDVLNAIFNRKGNICDKIFPFEFEFSYFDENFKLGLKKCLCPKS
jgi:hypothetical protein